MRTVPKDIADKLLKTIQTKGTDANPSTVAWISRPTTALTEDTFLEKQTVLDGTFTDASIAVCHPYFGATNTKLNLAYIENGVAKVLVAIARANMASHEWYETGFSENASAVALAYDGTMPKNTSGKYEFVTETQPWVFWVSAGGLYAQQIDGAYRYTLAEANCTDVTAVRAMWSDVPGFDFGLCVFFILSGVIYYRQFVDGEWTDAVPVPAAALPTGKTWVQVSAQRTWDYRVVLQIADTNGGIYETFTQFGGLGSKNAEHINISSVNAAGDIIEIVYRDTQELEHVDVSDIVAGAPYGGLYADTVPSIINAYNLNDGTDNYGKKAIFVFDTHLVASEVSEQSSRFSIVDMYGITYVASLAILGDDGKTVTLTFTDFNNAFGQCNATYTAGTVTSMYGTTLVDRTFSFLPVNLVHSDDPIPEVQSSWNE